MSENQGAKFSIESASSRYALSCLVMALKTSGRCGRLVRNIASLFCQREGKGKKEAEYDFDRSLRPLRIQDEEPADGPGVMKTYLSDHGNLFFDCEAWR